MWPGSTCDFLGYCGSIGRETARLKIAKASVFATAPGGENLAARETWRRARGDCGGDQPAAARLDELFQARPGQKRAAGTGRADYAQAAMPTMALRQASVSPGQDTAEARSDEGACVAFGDQWARCLVERRSQSHECGLPEVLHRPPGGQFVGRHLPALPASLMNRRMRNRTYGGVGGRGGNPSPYPIDSPIFTGAASHRAARVPGVERAVLREVAGPNPAATAFLAQASPAPGRRGFCDWGLIRAE
jgi:hypothetical protein